MSEQLDLLIRGGIVVDGTGAAAREGDVGIRGGRIAAIGKVDGPATRTIEARDRVVAPGFVDIHTHYDAQILWDRLLTISPWHGVTSVVMGNCGFGIAPTRAAHRELILRTLESVEGMSLDALVAGVGDDWPFETFPQYLDAVERRGSAINVGALIGHTPLRLFVMGEESTEREATDDEIAKMRAIVREALDAGALGFATSQAPTHVGYAGRPVPSRAATVAEIETLASCLGDAGHGVMQATIGRGFFLDEMAAIQKRTSRPVTWTALLAGMLGPDGHRWVLQKTAEMQGAGVNVVPQVSCRPLMVEFQFKAPFPFESLPFFQPVSAADHAGKARIYADPEFRAKLREHGQSGVLAARWQDTTIAESPSEPDLNERNLAEVAEQRGAHPVDLMLDLALASNLAARFRMAVTNTDEAIVGELLRDPTVVLGLSDAGAHASQLCDASFSTHLLGHWVRDKKALSLESAVRLLTSRGADLFGLADRGRLAVGAAADVVVFDPDTVGCSPLRRVNDLPAGADRLVCDAIGVQAVVVNGSVIREDGRDALAETAPLPGLLLRGGRTA
ncbi:MAG: amidohydrolase family protein [Deltaproteobacteria bacterium]|nr:amidohydrolase family protein [Deltaproteobacteria bacterium]